MPVDDQDAAETRSIDLREADDGPLEEVEGFRQPLPSTEIHKAKTARALAIASFGALCLVFLINYASVFWLAYHNRADAIEHVDRIFSTWVPIFAGLVGSAATFYFTQERR